MFILHTSKTHWKNNKPQIIKITATKVGKTCSRPMDNPNSREIKNYCPYALLQIYAQKKKKLQKD